MPSRGYRLILMLAEMVSSWSLINWCYALKEELGVVWVGAAHPNNPHLVPNCVTSVIKPGVDIFYLIVPVSNIDLCSSVGRRMNSASVK